MCAYEVETGHRPITLLVIVFLRESTEALDSNVALPRRLAIAIKWQNVLKGLGYTPKKKLTLSSSETDMIAELENMLSWIAVLVKRED